MIQFLDHGVATDVALNSYKCFRKPHLTDMYVCMHACMYIYIYMLYINAVAGFTIHPIWNS